MTEAEWLTCTDVSSMLSYLLGKVSSRKLRLFACACCRRANWIIAGERHRKLIEVAERYADGVADTRELEAAHETPTFISVLFATSPDPLGTYEVQEAAFFAGEQKGEATDQDEIAQAALLRELFGNPSRPVASESKWLAWNDATIPKIAQTIYDERAFERLPILADALEDASCDNADILNHCRQPGEHVRGCWVIDLLLGKE